MKLLVLLLFVGVVTSAPYHDAVDDAADEVLTEFLAEFEQDALELLYRAEEDTDEEPKTELGKKLREQLDDVLEKIKDAIDHGKKVKEELLDKAKDIREKLRDMKEDFGKKAKELYEKLKEALKEKKNEWWNKILDRLGLKEKDDGSSDDLAHSILGNILGKMKEMKDKMKDIKSLEDLKQLILDTLGKGSEIAKSWLDQMKGFSFEEAKEKILTFIRKWIPDKDDKKRSVKDAWEKIKDYFRQIKIVLKEKYAKFGEWVKDKMEQKKEVLKEKLEGLKKIAKEVHDDVKTLTREILEEAKSFFEEYREELGEFYKQLIKKINDELSKKE